MHVGKLFLSRMQNRVIKTILIWCVWPIMLLNLANAAITDDPASSHDKIAKKNVVLILADDLGWADLSITTSEFYETPNIAKLAKQGTFYRNAYSAATVCSPARGAIMSGQFPATNGYTGLEGQWGRPSKGRFIDAEFASHLALTQVTLAEALQQHGYHTAHFGKWHLGRGAQYGPLQQGFDQFYSGFEEGIWRGKTFPKQVKNYHEKKWQGKRFNDQGEFITDVLTDKVLATIDRNKNNPFFLNIWYWAVHTPIKAKAKDIAYFKAKAKRMGLDKVEPFQFDGYFPADPHYKKQQGTPVKKRIIQSDPVYAAFVYSLDQNIGRIMDKLDALGLTDNTVILFASDNGGLSSAEGSPTSNAPLKEGKGWSFDGGLRIPLIIKGTDFPANQTITTDVSTTDLYPTILAVNSLPLRPTQHKDGRSLLPHSQHSEVKQDRKLFWHSPHYFNNGGYPFSGVLTQGWKYVYRYDINESALFNLNQDPYETNNLALSDPDRVDKLKSQLNHWKKSVRAQEPKPYLK